MSALCIVCAAAPARGASDTCGQSCAGVLANMTRRVGGEDMAPWKAERRRYATDRKQGERECLRGDIMALPHRGSMLTFYGGGLDLEWAHSLRPDVRLVAVERNKALWPAMRDHARSVPFWPLEKDLMDLDLYRQDGMFDLIFADTCCEVERAADILFDIVNQTALLRWGCSRTDPPTGFTKPACGMVHRGWTVYLTVLGSNRASHEGLRSRLTAAPAIAGVLENVAARMGIEGRLLVELVHEYRQASSVLPAYLFRVGRSQSQWDAWEALIRTHGQRARGSGRVPTDTYDRMTEHLVAA